MAFGGYEAPNFVCDGSHFDIYIIFCALYTFYVLLAKVYIYMPRCVIYFTDDIYANLKNN
jgi:hypothetical protein